MWPRAPPSVDYRLTIGSGVHDPELYESYRRDPGSVGPWWRRYFQELEASSWLAANGGGSPPAAAAAADHVAHIGGVPLFRDLPAESQAMVAAIAEEMELAEG